MTISPAAVVPFIARGRVRCGIAATLASVTSEGLAAVANEMEGGSRAGAIDLPDRVGVRALIKTSM